jgi:hypothetical protein
MGHSIQAIITTTEVAHALRALYPQLPGVAAPQDFVILPVDADFIDAVSEARPSQTTDTFRLLTEAFHSLLRDLSRFGPLAYVETEYFGGVGGQGALVYSSREVLMGPQWQDSGPVNQALKLVGVKRRLFGDEFSALGLDQYRSNDDLTEAANSGRRERDDN